MLVSSLQKLAILVLPVALALMPRPASAQCAFDGLAKSKPIKLSMVRSYAPCSSPNVLYAGAEPACDPVAATDNGDGPTIHEFGPKGGCTVSLKGAIEDDCSLLTNNNGVPLGLPSGPCHVTYVKAKCTGILRVGLPINGPSDLGWSLLAKIRYSVNEGTDDITLPDAPVFGGFPVRYDFDTPHKGSISLESNSAIGLSAWIGPQYAALPPCANAQIVSLEILDPSNHVFAAPGLETR